VTSTNEDDVDDDVGFVGCCW